jgi:hypothetical protein
MGGGSRPRRPQTKYPTITKQEIVVSPSETLDRFLKSPAVKESPTSGFAAAGLAVVAKQVILPSILAVFAPPLVTLYYAASRVYAAVTLANSFLKKYENNGAMSVAVNTAIQVGTSLVMTNVVSAAIPQTVTSVISASVTASYKAIRPSASETELALAEETSANAVNFFVDQIEGSISDKVVAALEQIVGV